MMNLHIQVYLQREKTVGIAHKWLLPNLQDVRFRGAGWNSCESRRSEKQQQHCVAQAPRAVVQQQLRRGGGAATELFGSSA
jgi:predicted nucleic acid-binding Zn ribbon protein